MPGSKGTSASPACSATPAARPAIPRACSTSIARPIIHALAEVAPAVLRPLARAVVLPVVPMFHAAAWGLPFSGAMAGVKFVYSAVNDPVVLCDLMNEEKVTHTAGVPTVWLGMFQHMDSTGEKPEHLKIVTIGGSAAPRAMIERLMKMGIRVGHAWGMTEISPIGTIGSPPARLGRAGLRGAGRPRRQAGPGPVRGRAAHRRRRRPRAAARRQELGAAADPRAVGDQALFPGRARRLRRRGQLVRHRRRRRHPSRRHDADHRPLEGRDQVGRRVDQLGRARKRGGRLPRSRRGGGDRRPPSRNGTNGRCCSSSASRIRTSAPTRSAPTSPAMSPNGGCPTRYCSSTACRTRRPASCSRPRFATSTRSTSCRPPANPHPKPSLPPNGARPG